MLPDSALFLKQNIKDSCDIDPYTVFISQRDLRFIPTRYIGLIYFSTLFLQLLDKGIQPSSCIFFSLSFLKLVRPLILHRLTAARSNKNKKLVEKSS